MLRASLALGLVVSMGCSGSDPGGSGSSPQPPMPPGMSAAPTPSSPPGSANLPSVTPTPSGSTRPDGSGAPYPIVLLHGMFGFYKIQVANLEYWNGVPEDLKATMGETMVYVPVVPMLASSEVRAQHLKAFIDAVLAGTGKKKVNLIGHSQGGLDARYLVSSLGYADRVASVTTVSAPHHGSRVADALLGASPALSLLNPVLDLYGLLANQKDDPDLHQSLVALSQAYCDGTFNVQNPDDPRVAYFSWAGRSNNSDGGTECDGAVHANDKTHVDVVNALIGSLGSYLTSDGGPGQSTNDGLVPVHSAKWGTFMGCVPADHMDEIGQIGESGADPVSGFDHIDFYRTVVREIRNRGF
jgi:triacylglycerol lipase